MNKFIKSTLVIAAIGAGALAVTSPAIAENSSHFTSTLQAPSSNLRVNVTLGEDLAFRADNLSTKLSDRNNSRSLNNGFSNNGYFGQRDLDKLTKRLKKKMEARLVKSGFAIDDDATTVLNLVITDARPNRPTFKQMSKKSSLSMHSFGIGGAKFEGTLVDTSGQKGRVSYGWYETDIYDAQYSGTWTDAYRAIDRFARKTARSLK